MIKKTPRPHHEQLGVYKAAIEFLASDRRTPSGAGENPGPVPHKILSRPFAGRSGIAYTVLRGDGEPVQLHVLYSELQATPQAWCPQVP